MICILINQFDSTGPFMNVRSIMDRVCFSEWAILRYSPEPKFGSISILQKEQGRGAPLGRALVTGCRHRSSLHIAAAIALAAIFATSTGGAKQADAGDWIETWTASPQPIWDPEFFAPINIPRALRNQTVRQIAAISIGGNRVRVVLSNEYGSRPLVIGAANVALAGSGAATVAGSDRAAQLRRPPVGHDPTRCTGDQRSCRTHRSAA
jgi:hypothetical protein